MAEVDIKQIVLPDGTTCDIRDQSLEDFNEALELILYSTANGGGNGA